MADDYGSAPRNVPKKRHGTGRDARCADRLQPANGRRPDAPCPVRASAMEPCSMAIDDAAFPLNPLCKRMRVSCADQAASQHRANANRRPIFPYGNIHPRIQISAPEPSSRHAGACASRSNRCKKIAYFKRFSADPESLETHLDLDLKNAHAVSETCRSRVRYFQRVAKRDDAEQASADNRSRRKRVILGDFVIPQRHCGISAPHASETHTNRTPIGIAVNARARPSAAFGRMRSSPADDVATRRRVGGRADHDRRHRQLAFRIVPTERAHSAQRRVTAADAARSHDRGIAYPMRADPALAEQCCHP